MPRLTMPSDMPKEVTGAIDILGNRVRARIVRELSRSGPQTAPELADAIGARREIVYHHLAQLEAAGLVSADERAGHRHGRTVHWDAQSDQIQHAIGQLADYLAGN